MKPSTLVREVERRGGYFVVRGRKVIAAKVPAKFHQQLRQHAYFVSCWILEREASRKWEQSGRNPRWWCE